MNKLLNKSLKAFILYAALVLACSIPVYYYIVDSIWQHELKEHNLLVSGSIKHHLNSLQLKDAELAESIKLWNSLQPEMKLQAVEQAKPDSTYNVYKKNKHLPLAAENRFQGLITYFMLDGKTYSLTVETNMEETHETMIAITIATFIFFVILLGGVTILNRKIEKKLWHPFYQSLKLIKGFDLNNQQNIAFEKTSISEFEELNSSLSRLIAGNIATYKQQKEFIENASHELQTPLAIVQSKLDLLLQSSSLTNQQADIIDQTHKALARVNRVNKNLLLLAKIENSQFPDKEPIDLSDTLENNIALFIDFAQNKGITIAQRIAQHVIVQSNKILLEISISNLLLNAIVHTAEEGKIGVELLGNSLTISNTGLVALNKDNLFQRFSTTSSQTPGTGLGLAIVQQISMRYEWTTNYEFDKGLHIFKIIFP